MRLVALHLELCACLPAQYKANALFPSSQVANMSAAAMMPGTQRVRAGQCSAALHTHSFVIKYGTVMCCGCVA